ncbi:MAG: hypothetical protein IPH71_03705 [Proteobacteria bacterium]|jgi:hypothetical protein|nr:hypothetical protein [Pseudomonadota bacterium]
MGSLCTAGAGATIASVVRRDPHCAQNFTPGRLMDWQRGQAVVGLSWFIEGS